MFLPTCSQAHLELRHVEAHSGMKTMVTMSVVLGHVHRAGTQPTGTGDSGWRFLSDLQPLTPSLDLTSGPGPGRWNLAECGVRGKGP